MKGVRKAPVGSRYEVRLVERWGMNKRLLSLLALAVLVVSGVSFAVAKVEALRTQVATANLR